MSRDIFRAMRRRYKYWLIWWLAPRQWRVRLWWTTLAGRTEFIELGPLEIRRQPR